MKKILPALGVICLVVASKFSMAGLRDNSNYNFNQQDTLPTPPSQDPGTGTVTPNGPGGNGQNGNGNKNTPSNKLSPLLNFNFAGQKNTWTNLTPIVYYGWSVSHPYNKKVKIKTAGNADSTVKKKFMGGTIQVGPYIGTTISMKDSTSYLPGIMLPGNAGLEANYYFTLFNEEKFSIVISPLNLGLKVISGFTDSTISLTQHSIRHAIGFRFADYITLSGQYTTGWHDLTNYSEENFVKVFGKTNTTIRYWNVTLTTRLAGDLFGNNDDNKTPLYFTISLRSLAGSSMTGKYNLPNNRFVTVGLVTDLNLKSGTNPGFTPKSPFSH